MALGPIKAIPTAYKGCRFRSRTEARWAVFFDSLGIIWIYEVEGFDLNGSWFLPDFYLPEQETWVEIKGVEPNSTERRNAIRLAKGLSQRVIIFRGQPWPGEHSLTIIAAGAFEVHSNLFLGEINGALCAEDRSGVRLELQRPYHLRQTGPEFQRDTRYEGSAIGRAFAAARGTRFERVEHEFDELLSKLNFLIELSKERSHVANKIFSVCEIFEKIGLKPLRWKDHVFAFISDHDHIGCIMLRENDRRWTWLEIEWQRFMRKEPVDSPLPSHISKHEYDKIKSIMAREIRADPLRFLSNIGVDVALSWRNLALALFVKDGWLELIVMRTTDSCWWSVPFELEMFEQI